VSAAFIRAGEADMLKGMNGTRNIKDTLFVALFNNEAAARELYNAINGTHYGLEMPVTMSTLDDVLYRGIRNDVSFTVADTYMALFEQQSSFNRNIPLRVLLYIARLYERLIPNKDVHKEALLLIPRPHAVVFYTRTDSGKDAMKQNRVILRLSDAFKGVTSGLGSLEGVHGVSHAASGGSAAGACGISGGRPVHRAGYTGGFFPRTP
jgi:hypothetical protein